MSVIDNYKKIIENIKLACNVVNRDYKTINVVAVSKKQNIKKIRALASVGHKSFGENRLEETIEKWSNQDKKMVKLHFIGALQSKKIKELVKTFDVIETLDTESSAKKLSILKIKTLKFLKFLFK